ncbi:MFS transporter [Paenarthrobacter nitroguajacolicus]|uniref:MFS transporter n=1 Tax=Paenarthrobacter nitroguajacolicus TaxID=211146 RepID=UPI0015BBC8BC|nr:MFS transporter [Paenarthrobacter nitroguajacolicus]NWL33205.1 MFS transporter [Paenarthrobacter nitroguajacolicus]
MNGPGNHAKRSALWLCLGAGFITLLDQSMFVLAVPAMSASLHADSGSVQWILASYSLAFGVALVPAGRLGDIVGRRTLFIAGIAVFGASSLLGGLAADPSLVIIARLLQGLGAGTLNPQVLGLLQDVYSGPDRAKALGAYAAAGGSAAVCGPLIGGLVLSLGDPSIGWRILFLANVPLVLVLVPLAFRLLPRPAGKDPRNGTAKPSIDILGALLLGGVVIASLIPTIYGAGTIAVTSLAIGGGALLAFAGWEILYHRRGRTPLISAALMKSRGYALGTVVALCQFGVGAGMAAVTAFYFLAGSGMAPLAAAAILAPQAAGMLLASSFSWRFVARYGRGGIVFALVGSLACLVAKDLFVQGLDGGTAALAVAAVGLFQGVATGLVVAPNQTLTLAHAPVGAAGVAAGFYQLSQRFAAALCSAAAAGMFLDAHRAATGEASKDAFHQGIVMCCILLGVALLAGGLDWLREARDRRNRNAAVVTSGKEAPTTAAGTQRSEATEAVDA